MIVGLGLGVLFLVLAWKLAAFVVHSAFSLLGFFLSPFGFFGACLTVAVILWYK